jgi:hypothetical protein
LFLGLIELVDTGKCGRNRQLSHVARQQAARFLSISVLGNFGSRLENGNRFGYRWYHHGIVVSWLAVLVVGVVHNISGGSASSPSSSRFFSSMDCLLSLTTTTTTIFILVPSHTAPPYRSLS